jgi:hypothetical protein
LPNSIVQNDQACRRNQAFWDCRDDHQTLADLSVHFYQHNPVSRDGQRHWGGRQNWGGLVDRRSSDDPDDRDGQRRWDDR